MRESRDALLCRARSQQALLFNHQGISHPSEVVARLQRLAPCIAAQLDAAAIGLCAHNSRHFVSDEVHVFGMASKHLFTKPIGDYSVEEIKCEQRGMRKSVYAPPPPPPYIATCEDVEQQLCAKFAAFSGKSWNLDALPFVPILAAEPKLAARGDYCEPDMSSIVMEESACFVLEEHDLCESLDREVEEKIYTNNGLPRALVDDLDTGFHVSEATASQRNAGALDSNSLFAPVAEIIGTAVPKWIKDEHRFDTMCDNDLAALLIDNHLDEMCDNDLATAFADRAISQHTAVGSIGVPRGRCQCQCFSWLEIL